MHQTLIFGQDVAKSRDARRVREPWKIPLYRAWPSSILHYNFSGLQINDILFPLSFDLGEIGIFFACVVDAPNFLYRCVCELVHNIVFQSRRVARTYVDGFDWLVSYAVVISPIWIKCWQAKHDSARDKRDWARDSVKSVLSRVGSRILHEWFAPT